MLQLLEFVRLICPVGREVRERVTGAATEAESIVIFRTLTRSDYYHTNLHTVTVRSYDTKKRLLATPLGLSTLKFTLCSIMIFTLFLGRRSTNSRALNFFLPQFIDLHANLGSRFEPSLLLDSICTPPAVAERNTLTAGVATHTPKSYILVVVVVAYLLSSMNRENLDNTFCNPQSTMKRIIIIIIIRVFCFYNNNNNNNNKGMWLCHERLCLKMTFLKLFFFNY